MNARRYRVRNNVLIYIPMFKVGKHWRQRLLSVYQHRREERCAIGPATRKTDAPPTNETSHAKPQN